MMPRTDDPLQALVNANAVLGQPEPTEDDLLAALLDCERGVRDKSDGDLWAQMDTARLALTERYADLLLAQNPGLDNPPVSDDRAIRDPLVPGGAIGLTRAERILRRAHWS